MARHASHSVCRMVRSLERGHRLEECSRLRTTEGSRIMGTSVSHRSPVGSLRWRAARASLRGNFSDEQIATQMLAAASADAWPAMIGSGALSQYAATANLAVAEIIEHGDDEISRADTIRRLVEQARF